MTETDFEPLPPGRLPSATDTDVPSDPDAGSVTTEDVAAEELWAIIDRLTRELFAQRQVLDHLSVANEDFDDAVSEPSSADGAGSESKPKTTSICILAFDPPQYTAELAALRLWVEDLLLPVYGREISTNRPWCERWQEHPEAVVRLHGLWLAFQQLTDAEAGLTGPATWHRDHLDPTLAQLRDPGGPFGACTTNATRPNHRLLASPAAAPVAGLGPKSTVVDLPSAA
ncbi:DUF4913 domain-containing protein [Embleya sp. NPDC059259]|uniref:DUF4913 domain-containing protein n=1 Tax=unclassified Embleya TaxID=2699296 RepID=UPI003693D511